MHLLFSCGGIREQEIYVCPSYMYAIRIYFKVFFPSFHTYLQYKNEKWPVILNHSVSSDIHVGDIITQQD